MKFIKFIIRQSIVVNLISIFLIVVGITSLFKMQREAFPNVAFDIVTVRTAYLGAFPEEVEDLVTRPIEEELQSVSGIDEINSFCIENSSLIVIKIDPDVANKDKVVTDIQRAVDRVKDLPEDAEDPLVEELTTKDRPVIVASVSGDIPELELQKYSKALQDKFEDIKGVSSVKREGWREREIWVEAKPEKLKENYISFDEIINSLKNKNLNLPGGIMKTGKEEFIVRTIGEFKTAKEVENVIIRANDQGYWVRIKDVCNVRDTFEDTKEINKTNGRKSINLIIVKKQSGDTIYIVKEINNIIKQFRKYLPRGVNVSLVDDMSYYIKRRLNVLVNNGWIGISLVVLSLLLFLSKRVAIMTALGIPIAFMTTFWVMNLMGISINLISMFGLIIVLGMLVDDAIIIAENSYRHMEYGLNPAEAAVKGVSEVIKPVTATIMTTIAAFLPLMFMGGIIGKFIRVIPVVVVIALLASLFEAIVILPSHIADFARLSARAVKKQAIWFGFLITHYLSVLKFALRKRYLVMLSVMLILIGAFILFKQEMSFVLFPQRGIEMFYIRMEMPSGTTIDRTNKVISKVEDILLETPANEIENFITSVGNIQGREVADSPSGTKGTHLAQIIVYLTPETQRKRKADEIIEDLREQTKDITGFERLYFERVRTGPPVGKAVEVRIRGDEYPVLTKIAQGYKDYLKTIDGVRDIKDDYELGKEEIRVIVDEEAASMAFLSISDIAGTIRTAFQGTKATTIRKGEEEIDVVVRLPEKERNDLKALDNLLIQNKQGNLIPLHKICRIENARGIAAIKHRDNKRVVTVTADIAEGKTTSLKVNLLLSRHFRNIEKKFIGYNVIYGGEQKDTIESMMNLLKAFGIALLVIFIILTSLFKSLIQPLIVMFAIPLGLVGVIIAFFFHNEPISFMALLGVIGLTGVVVNDSIVLVDFINKMRLQGKERIEAIMDAGRMRIRPVILTTITTVLGIAPVAYGIGGNDPFLKPMALAISWGLLFATILTLIIIPCSYAIVDDFIEKFQDGKKK